MTRTICLIMFLSTILSACAVESPESKQVKGVVMQYNTLLAEGYKNLNMNPLQLAATQEVATKAYYHMAALGEGKVRMVSVLKDITFKEVTFPTPETATVTTRETWDFNHSDINAGKILYQEKGYPYEMTYELKKGGGQWKIQAVSAVGEERSDDARAARPGAGQGPAGNGSASSVGRVEPLPQPQHAFVDGNLRGIAEVAAGGADVEPMGAGQLVGHEAGHGRFSRQAQQAPDAFADAADGRGQLG